MTLLAWMFSPIVTIMAILHTTLSSVVGLAVMAVKPNSGDWMMWNVGRRFWSRPLLKWIVGAKLDVAVDPMAQALADAGNGAVLVANHTSLLDINAAFSASPTPIVFLSKASVRKVPLLGKLNELAGTVFVERGNRASSERAVNQLTSTLKNGRSVLVFPEPGRPMATCRPSKRGRFIWPKPEAHPSSPCTSMEPSIDCHPRLGSFGARELTFVCALEPRSLRMAHRRNFDQSPRKHHGFGTSGLELPSPCHL